MPRSPRSSPRTTLALAGILALSGCAGHGNYTKKHLNASVERAAQMRAANEYQMAEQAFLAGDLAKALIAVDRSITVTDQVPKSHVLRGRILIEQSDLEAAVASLTRAEALDASNVDAQYYLGIVYERFTRREDALARYLRAAELERSNPQFAVAAAEMMIDLGRLGEAQEYLDGHKALFEHNAGVRQTLAHIALMRGDPERSVELFNEARLLAPDDHGVLEDLVRVQIVTGRFAEAEYSLAKLSALPENAKRRDLMHMRARCLMNVDRPVEARELLLGLTGDAAGSKDVDAWVELGNVSIVLRDMNRLRMAAQRVIALAPQRSEGYVLRAMWQIRQGDRQAALETLNKAVERRAGQTEPLILRAMVLEELGRFAEARDSYALALEQDPGNKWVARAVASTTATATASAAVGD